MSEAASKLTIEDLVDFPDFPEAGAVDTCDFSPIAILPLPVSRGGVWRPRGARPLGAEEWIG